MKTNPKNKEASSSIIIPEDQWNTIVNFKSRVLPIILSKYPNSMKSVFMLVFNNCLMLS